MAKLKKPKTATGAVDWQRLSRRLIGPPYLHLRRHHGWQIEHGFRLAKQEAGLMHYEGRDYTGLMRHLILALVVLGFVALHTERLRGKNPRVTAEQVCRALNQRCAVVLRRRRVPERRHLSEVIGYHQRRNEQTISSHKKRWRRCVL